MFKLEKEFPHEVEETGHQGEPKLNIATWLQTWGNNQAYVVGRTRTTLRP